ncbi:hypothetical protein CGMCC3_g14333 [Colletotrichum fructicola]|nr:uncharacterized protein CGMCC3_g14333 [Colletotrichum fructicola]KAE9569561.1 hypothetical protein CGMCC3_g14333 [Colletotrichum fructicola]
MTTDQRPRRREDFRIAVLCALPLEYNAATLAFDEFFDEDGDKFGRARGDPNRYTTGRIGKYNVVMALLPGMGTVSSASAMASFRSSYTELKLALLVGICGGVPSPGTEKEVLLGDVIMSKTVVQYDFGRQNPHRFTTKDTLSDSLGRPNKDIRSLLASLETERTFERLERRTAEILTGIQQTAAQAGRKRTRYPYPGAAQDGLFSPTYEHRHRDDADCGCDDTWICDTAPDASCIELECDKTHLVLRESLEIKKRLEREGNTAAAQEPHILIGSVGSGNAVMRSGAHRDEIAQRYDLIAFEMEAAGAWDEVPCIVIKGVCDYADSHKNKKWQTFAAAAAASSMKALLELYIQTDSPGNSKIEFTTQRINEILTWISKEPYEQHHTLNKSEVLEGTGKWLLEDEVFQSWKNNKTSSILWLHGIPGSGKSKLTLIVVEDAMQSSPAATVYFYCSRNPAEPGRSNPTSIVASIARQLAMPQPGADILDAAVEAYRKFEDNAFASQALTLGESERLIHKLLDSYRGQTIIMIIDAIDESNRDTRQDLLDFLVSLLEASTIMKVFVSSRDDRDIVYKLDKYENLYLSSERNSEDIELFVRLETSRLVSKGSLLRGSSRKEELRDKIIFELISNAHGMFRWASLHIQELCHQATDAAIEERLAKMPRTLEGLYREILGIIETRDSLADREMAGNAFRWLLCAQQQFASDVFLAMVSGAKDASNPTLSREQLLELCNNMVLFDETLDASRFSHLSVREFLEGEPAYRMTTTHALAAEQCILKLTDIPPILMPLTPLLEYSIYFWADHAKQAGHGERQSRLSLILANFFVGEKDRYSSFSRWHDRVSHKDYTTEMSWTTRHKFKDALSYAPSVMLVICMFDLSGVLSPERWQELAEAHPKNLDGVTHEELVIRYGSIQILQWHFEARIPFNLTTKHVEVVAGSEANGIPMMSFLLKRFDAEIRITPEVTKVAVSNLGCGDKILLHLLETRGYEIIITDDIVRAAVQNPGKAVEITSLLFNRYKSQIRITPDIAMAAFRNSAGIVKLLLDERGDEIDFSTDMILNAVKDGGRFSSSALILLMDMRNGQIHITEHFITTIASSTSCDRDLVERLLDEFGDEIQNTEAFFHAVIEKRGDKDIIMLLFDRLGTKLQNPARFMETIVNKFDKTTVRRFIDLHGGLIQINNTIVKAAVENECFAEDVVALLLDEYWDEVHITEDILEAVFENEYRGEWIMDLLLNERPHEIQITEELVMMAAQSQYGMMELILDRCGDNIDITDEIIDSCPFAHTIMAIIGRREEYKIKVTEKLLIQAAEQFNGITTQHGGLLQFLLDQRREDVCITEKIVSAAAGNGSYGVRLISLLIDRCGENIFITTKTLQAAASNTYSGDQVMGLLLRWRGDSIRITESVVEAAVQNREGQRVMAVLFAARGKSIPITEHTLLLAVENVYSADKVIEMILYCCGDSIRITEEIMSVAVQNRLCGSRVVESILEMYRDDVPVTNEIVWLAAGNEECGDKVVELLLGNCRGDTRITSETFQAAVRNSKCSHGIMAAIFDTPGVVDEKDEQLSVAIQEAPYDASRLGHGETVEVLLRSTADIDATGGYFGNALQVASFSGHRWVVQILLHNGADVNASAGFFGYALQAAAYCGYLNIIHLLIQNGADVNARGGAYETALEAASSEGHEATVQVLLERNADIHAQGGIENNALYAASLGGHTMIVQMLLQNNADVNTLGGKFGNALQAASFKGRQETVQMLLEYGADASCENGFYGGSMQAASAAIVASVEQPCHTLLKAAITPFYSYCLPTPM